MHLAELALKHRLPGIFWFKENVEAGGLMSYSADMLDLYRRSAVYIDKILKGAKPADLSVEQADREGARHRNPAHSARARRRGDRINYCNPCTAFFRRYRLPGLQVTLEKKTSESSAR